ncbi:hypothetical protein RhiirA4_489129 [Rhizophagus irregularis]|uniref:Uncharacterized protein n=1 Tax=Rhizophagus irregularis TaxID=588596 RepID=A0A2I1HUJ5_9GLOM|nr:hypothetical protein RhiirA4_489129 [Rhizophagus irregularis]
MGSMGTTIIIIFFYASCLYLKYRLGYFNSELNNLSYTSLGWYLTYYYKVWFKKRPEDFCKKVEPFNDETFEQFGDDVFKFWSFIEVRCNRLTNDKVLAINQLRASINFSLRKKELQQNKAQFLDLNVETEVGNPEVEDSEIPEDIENELNEWEEILIEEEVVRMEEEEALRENSNSNLEGDLLSKYTHPAIGKRAKWGLRSLFSSSLNAPDYLNEMLNM